MKIVNNLLSLNSLGVEVYIDEDFNKFHFEMSICNNLQFSDTFLKDIITKLPERDSAFRLQIKTNDDILASLFSINEIEQFINDVRSISVSEDERFIFEFHINKQWRNRAISVYDLTAFAKTLNGHNLEGLLSIFNDLKDCHSHPVTLELMDEDERAFNSQCLMFVPYNIFGRNYNGQKYELRSKIDKRDSACAFLGASKYEFCPDDFFLLNRSENNILNNLFDRLTAYSVLMYIANISKIDKNDIYVRIDGYKLCEYRIDFKNRPELIDSKVFWDIYNWIYTDGNYSDKIGLARNIISLFLNKSSIWDIDDSVFSSIKSNHELYLKENVKQYIDAKMNISQHIIDMSQKANTYVEDFAHQFRNNILAFFTYFISVVVLNALNSGKFINIFTRDITIISLSMLALSLLLFIAAILETDKKLIRFKKQYEIIKESYQDVFIEKDLKNILHEDKQHIEDCNFIKKGIQTYAIIWVWMIIIFTIMVLILSLAF